MSESGKITIPDHAHGYLAYLGTDHPDDLRGAMATIGAALHFAADHLEQFRDETNAATAEDTGSADGLPTEEQYRACLKFAHALASPGCAVPIP